MSKIVTPSPKDVKLSKLIIDALNADSSEKLVLSIDGKNIKLTDQMSKQVIKLLEAIATGQRVSISSLDTQMTTQEAAEYLGYSRPTLIKLLDEHKIAISKVGKHRKIRFESLLLLQKKIESNRQQAIRDLQRLEVELGLLDKQE